MISTAKKVSLKNNYTGYTIEGDTDLISVEYEVAWDPGTTERRFVWEYLTHEDFIRYTEFPSHSVILEGIIKACKEHFPFFENFSVDGGGIEANIPPMCLTLHKSDEIQEYLVEYMDFLKYLGFSDESLSAGIHVNVDMSMLGRTQLDKSETVRKLCQFAFDNIDFVIKFSGRKRGAQILSDMYHFLGDVYNLKPKSENLREFLIHKNLLADFFMSDNTSSHLSLFNMHAGKCGRDALEIRWFGTTLDIKEYYQILEFAVSLIRFSRESTFEKLSESDYIQYVKEHPTMYNNLLDKLITHINRIR